MATTGSFFVPTGMTTAERWWEVGRRVENGDAFSDATWHVFGSSDANNLGAQGWFGVSLGVSTDEYANAMSILAYFLALEAEDAEFDATFGDLPAPPTADVVAEEEPMVEYTHVHIGEFAVPARQPDRRRTWNQKVADGLRKWAHWMEERF